MKYFILVFTLIFTFSISGCELLEDLGLSEAEVVAGLKEALTVGSDNSVEEARQVDGYNGNPLIKILLPEEAATVATVLNTVQLGFLVDELVIKLNRAAEDAASAAAPIFIDAVTEMTIEDAWGILNGNQDAATRYLEQKTYPALYDLFQPAIENSLAKVGANAAWETVMTEYNAIPFVQPVNTDLAAYTTDKALTGLFVLLAKEELKIREDVNARVSDLLQRVFAEQD